MSDETTTQSAVVPAPPDASIARSDGAVKEVKEAATALSADNAMNDTATTTEIKGISHAY
jgi:hypothetical protein